jgi:hypothetical protein
MLKHFIGWTTDSLYSYGDFVAILWHLFENILIDFM